MSGGVVPGSRYSFRPSSTLPSSLSAPSAVTTPAVGLLAGPAHASAYKSGMATASKYAGGLVGGGQWDNSTGSTGTTFHSSIGAGAFGSSAATGAAQSVAASGNNGVVGGSAGYGEGGGGFQSATAPVTGASFRSAYGGGSHLTSGPGASGPGSVMMTPAPHRLGGGGSFSVSSSLSFGASLPSARAVDPTPAPSRYGLVTGGGFSSAPTGTGAGGPRAEAGR